MTNLNFKNLSNEDIIKYFLESISSGYNPLCISNIYTQNDNHINLFKQALKNLNYNTLLNIINTQCQTHNNIINKFDLDYCGCLSILYNYTKEINNPQLTNLYKTMINCEEQYEKNIIPILNKYNISY